MIRDHSLYPLSPFMYDILSPSLLTLSLIEGVSFVGSQPAMGWEIDVFVMDYLVSFR
jgi:uncharacterized protein YcnI